ncbi:hypothetical protein [Lysobacter sp. A421]
MATTSENLETVDIRQDGRMDELLIMTSSPEAHPGGHTCTRSREYACFVKLNRTIGHHTAALDSDPHCHPGYGRWFSSTAFLWSNRRFKPILGRFGDGRLWIFELRGWLPIPVRRPMQRDLSPNPVKKDFR